MALISTKTPAEVHAIIAKYLPSRHDEKKDFGEVFTPVSLIETLFDEAARHHKLHGASIWQNPELRWLDPAAGVGNFPMLAYLRLMEGLQRRIPSRAVRSKHIIQNMLYMVELNERNVRVLRKLFGKDANIFHGSFLNSNTNQVNPAVLRAFEGAAGFDVVMGNPPFQEGRVQTAGTNAGRKTLWDKFIMAALSVLSPAGLLVFITPSNWRGLGLSGSVLWPLLSRKQPLYIGIYGMKDGHKYFGVGSRFDAYIIQNKPNTKPTVVVDEHRERHRLDLTAWPFLPNYDYGVFRELLTSPDKGIRVLYDTVYHTIKPEIKPVKSGRYVYPVVHAINADGVSCWYTADKTRGHFGVPKVLLNFNQLQYAWPEQNDYAGRLGMSQLTFGLPIKSKKEGEQFLKAFETPAFKEVIKATKWGAFQTDYRMFKYFKPDFYKYFLKSDRRPKPRKTIKKRSRSRSGRVEERGQGQGRGRRRRTRRIDHLS